MLSIFVNVRRRDRANPAVLDFRADETRPVGSRKEVHPEGGIMSDRFSVNPSRVPNEGIDVPEAIAIGIRPPVFSPGMLREKNASPECAPGG